MVQLYCEKDQRFLADRYVEGECPKCNYEVSLVFSFKRCFEAREVEMS